jgi:hypothetical protein
MNIEKNLQEKVVETTRESRNIEKTYRRRL